MRTANERLQSEVLDELRWDPQVDVSVIGVVANDGVVTLYGEIPSWPMRVAAIDAAARVAGVRAVAEQFILKYPGSRHRSDTDLAHEVVNVLHEARCPATIKAHVQGGELRLEGFADWPFQRDGAEAAVVHELPRLHGLKNITNDIIVSQPATLPSVLDRPGRLRVGVRTAP